MAIISIENLEFLSIIGVKKGKISDDRGFVGSLLVTVFRSKLIGCCATTFGELKERVANGEAIDFVLINEEKQTGKNADKYENSGTFSNVSEF